MKVTNISNSVIYLKDLRITHESQTEARRGEDRYLGPGHSAYLQNTAEVLRSAFKGDLKHLRDAGYITLEDRVTVAASGGADTAILTHGYGYPPVVYTLKQVGITWVDATGTVDIVHNADFTTTSITNTLGVSQTLVIRLI